jgi:MFS family permease
LHHFLFHFHPNSKGLKAYGSEDLSSELTSGGSFPSRDWTIKQMLHAYPLWLLVISHFLFWGVSCSLVLSHQVKYAEDAGYNAVLAVSVFALYGVAMLSGQTSGLMSDRIGREKAMILSSIAALAGLYALTAVHDTSSPWLLYIYALGFGYGTGLFSSILFAGAADIFYGKHFGTASGILLTGMGLGGSIGPWLGGYVYDTTGSYNSAFILCMACIILASASYWIAAPRNADKLNARRLNGSEEERHI